MLREETETCPHCMSDNTILHDVEQDGYQVICQHCGKPIMLCDACMHSDDNPGRKCDWTEETNCFRKPYRKTDTNDQIPTSMCPDILRHAIDIYGKELETDRAIEEMSELTKALLKYRKCVQPDTKCAAQANIYEEMADVIITLHTLLMIHNGKDTIQKIINTKMSQLAKRLYQDTFGFQFAFESAAYGKKSHKQQKKHLTPMERQIAYNMGFHAFQELAKALQISNQDLSLEGALKLTLNISEDENPTAQYKPRTRVINLTQSQDVESLAYAWWQAFDHYLGTKFKLNTPLSEYAHRYPKMAKMAILVHTIKYEKESQQQADVRSEKEYKLLQELAEKQLKHTVLEPLTETGNNVALDQYQELKNQFLSGEADTVNQLNTLKKGATGHVIPKRERNKLEQYERIFRERHSTPLLINTQFHRNAIQQGEYRNRELTAKAFVGYIKNRMGHGDNTDKTQEAINKAFDALFTDLEKRKLITPNY